MFSRAKFLDAAPGLKKVAEREGGGGGGGGLRHIFFFFFTIFLRHLHYWVGVPSVLLDPTSGVTSKKKKKIHSQRGGGGLGFRGGFEPQPPPPPCVRACSAREGLRLHNVFFLELTSMLALKRDIHVSFNKGCFRNSIFRQVETVGVGSPQRYCGILPEFVWTSRGSTAVLRFHSDHIFGGKGVRSRVSCSTHGNQQKVPWHVFDNSRRNVLIRVCH